MPTCPSEEKKGQMLTRLHTLKLNLRSAAFRGSEPRKHFNFTWEGGGVQTLHVNIKDTDVPFSFYLECILGTFPVHVSDICSYIVASNSFICSKFCTMFQYLFYFIMKLTEHGLMNEDVVYLHNYWGSIHWSSEHKSLTWSWIQIYNPNEQHMKDLCQMIHRFHWVINEDKYIFSMVTLPKSYTSCII
jgi:hypothetical protein